MKSAFVLITVANLIIQVLAVPTLSGSDLALSNTTIQSLDNGQVFCSLPGNPCWVVKRTALAVADVLVQRRWFRGHGWTNFCGGPGTSCKRYAEDLVLSQARDTSELNHDNFSFCSTPGIFCNDKRAALEKIGAAAEKAFLSVRILENNFQESGSSIHKREANPWWSWSWRGRTEFCGAPGTSCHKRRNPAPEAVPGWRSHGFWGFCGTPGSGCGRKRDAEELAEVDPSMLAAAQRAVDAINAIDPAVLKSLCFVENGECHSILTARDAFLEVKNENGDLVATGSDEAGRNCAGPRGACTLARRVLGELEDAVLAAARNVEAY